MAVCDKYYKIMTAVLDGVADEKEKSDFIEHIKACDDCKRLYHELSWMQKETKKLSADPPIDLKEIILQKVNEQTQEERIVHLRRRRTLRNAVISVAASAAILVAVFVGGYDLIEDYFQSRDGAAKGNEEMFAAEENESQTYKSNPDNADRGLSYFTNDEMNGMEDPEDELYDKGIVANSPENEAEMTADTVLSHEEIMEKVRSAFINMRITGYTREVIFMSASRYPDGVTGEAVPDIPYMRLYTVEDYQAFSEKVANVLTGSYYELTGEEISELGLHNGGSKIMVLIALDS